MENSYCAIDRRAFLTTVGAASLAALILSPPWAQARMKDPRDVNLDELQGTLRRDDVVLDVERVTFDFEIPEDRIRRD